MTLAMNTAQWTLDEAHRPRVKGGGKHDFPLLNPQALTPDHIVHEIEKSLSGYSYPAVLDVGIARSHCTKKIAESPNGCPEEQKRRRIGIKRYYATFLFQFACMQRRHRSSVFFKEEMAFSEIQFLSDVPIVREKLSGVEKSIDGKLKHYKRSCSRRPLIQGFVNNQSRTNLLLKQKRKVIAAKEAISLPEGSAPKECKQENQVESLISHSATRVL
ncbi:hypothetical protein M513_06745 [Trichuris suis]|uniref:Uncharacterized protein n=1 Tax=Trichuris suis TaxID=68888 RepID=A0A085M568_9BILA|nr:hypothetical protein M513_06745 [Trichuris suis]